MKGLQLLGVGVFSFAAVAGSVAKADLVSVWGFEEANGTTALDSGPAGNDGTYMGTATPVATGQTSGPFGQALSVSTATAGNLVSVPDDGTLDFTGSFSVQAWINPSAVGGVIAAKHAAPGDRGWQLDYRNMNGGNRVYFAVFSGDNFDDRYEASSFLVNTNEWTHITVVYDDAANGGNGEIRIYRNGVLGVATSAKEVGWSGDPRTNTQPLRIGDGFSGLLDEVAVFDHAVASGNTYDGWNQSLVPEPASVLLVGCGGLLAFMRRHPSA